MASTRDPTEKPEGFLQSMVYHATEVQSLASKVYVYEAPLRLWHWVNAACIVVLVITGYLIGQPPPSIGGEASSHFCSATSGWFISPPARSWPSL